MPVVWGADGIAAVAAYRWRTQLNENAKVPAFSAAMSELDHNEIVGWNEESGRRFAIVALRVEGEGDDLDARYAFTAGVARAAGATVDEIWATGERPLARLLSLVVTGDFASTYLGILRGVDPTPVEAIARLKEHLR
ncbi:MAG: SIS domain-containing protein [Actinomycetota bacterium]